MYKIGDNVKYRCPQKLQSVGEIVSKHKILDSGNKLEIGKILYLIKYDEGCYLDNVLEEDIIGNWRLKQ